MSEKISFSEVILRLLAKKQAVLVSDIQKEALSMAQNGSKTDEKKLKYALSRALKNLDENGLIETLRSHREAYVRLTKEGKQKLVSLKLEDTTSPVPLSWDGYWRIVLLDLPEARKKERESLRYLLKKAGFVLLKNSAWISPYPFEYLFTNLKKDLGLTTEVIILRTQAIDEETEENLMKLYKLK